MSMEDFLKRDFTDEASTDERLEQQLQLLDIPLLYRTYYKHEIQRPQSVHVHNLETYLHYAREMSASTERRSLIHYQQHLEREYDASTLRLADYERMYKSPTNSHFVSLTRNILQNIKFVCDNILKNKLEKSKKKMPELPDDLENEVYAIARRIHIAFGRYADLKADRESFVARILADPLVFGLKDDGSLGGFVDLHGLGLKERFKQVAATKEEKTQALIDLARLCGIALQPAQPDASETSPGVDGHLKGEAAQAAPAVAPVLWRDRTPGRGTNPAKFIQEHYGEWLGTGLTRADIKRVDPELYQAYAQWIRPTRHPEDDLNLPTRTVVRRADESPEETLKRQRQQEATRQRRYRDKQRSLTK